MTKAEERKILEKIVDLIQSTPMDSYIRSAFSGVPEYAVRNIDDDAAYNPVEERDMWEKRYNELLKSHADAEKEVSQRILRLEHERDAMAETIKAKDAEIEKLGHMLDAKVAEVERLRDERDVIAECHEDLSEMIDKYEQEIMRLKAEVYDLRKWGESPVVPERM